jgi:Tfp pilus assembly protein PilN
MDLIPSEFRQAQKAKRMLRRFALAMLVAVILIFSCWGILNLLIASKQREIASLRERDGSSQRQLSSVNELKQRKQRLEEQISALARLRSGKKVSILLRSLDASHLDGVWLETLRLQNSTRFEDMAVLKLAVTSVLKNEPVALPAGFDAELTGHALDHSKLAAYMRTLGTQQGVKKVDLLDTKLQWVGDVSALDFTLVLFLESEGSRP